MATMKAARWHAAKDVRIQEVEVPEVLPHQVKVAVKFTGICGTDLHEFLDGPIFIPTEEHVYSGQKAPVTLGHEFSGEIDQVIDISVRYSVNGEGLNSLVKQVKNYLKLVGDEKKTTRIYITDRYAYYKPIRVYEIKNGVTKIRYIKK